MTASALSRTQRVVLLGVLAFCLTTMHHLTTSTGMPEMSPAAQVTSLDTVKEQSPSRTAAIPPHRTTTTAFCTCASPYSVRSAP
ncbi:hypothetical protein [Amycolatopsis orientalis]|uniref:hypothetical protein n=1 Tax=Amycolatopsis orientalis TaxID=31958 RepID=UPI0003F6E20C|nr:hypothetical protein [Amycolatopsis orientalis]